MKIDIDNRWISFGFFIISVILFVIVVCLSSRKTSKTSTPVEEIQIDSIERVNNKLIIEAEILDSIKDVEKDKVFNLNNDSTLKLFYELLGK